MPPSAASSAKPGCSNGRVFFSGRVLPPLSTPTAALLVSLECDNCRRSALLARINENPRTGWFAFSLPDPVGQQGAFYRLATTARATLHSAKAFPTYSLTEAVALH